MDMRAIRITCYGCEQEVMGVHWTEKDKPERFTIQSHDCVNAERLYEATDEVLADMVDHLREHVKETLEKAILAKAGKIMID